MLAPSAWSSTTPCAVRAGTAPLPLSGCTPPPTAVATERMSLSATTTTAASLAGGLIPDNPPVTGVRALQTAAAALSSPLLFSDLYNCSATALSAREPQSLLPSTPAAEAHATENATWDMPTEAVGQAAAPAWDNHAAAGTAAPPATQCNLQDLHRERAPVIATTAPAAVESVPKEVLAVHPGGAGGTESLVRTASVHSAKGTTLPACLGTTAACVRSERTETVSTALEAKFKAAARPHVLLADPLLTNTATEEGAVSAARQQQQQQWRQAELLQRQRELQQRLLVLQEQQRQRDEAAAAERWSSCRWISTAFDVISEEEEGHLSVSDAKAGTVSFGGPSGSIVSCSISFPKEPMKEGRYQLAAAPPDSSVKARNSPKCTPVGIATRSTAAGAAVADRLAAAAGHTAAAAGDSRSTGENMPAGLKVNTQEECEERVFTGFAASRATNVTSTPATCMVFPAAVAEKVQVANCLGDGSNGLLFPYMFWQEDGDVEAVAGVTEEPSETSTHAHSGSSSPTEEPASGPLTLRGAAAAASADAAATPVADRSSSDKLQHDRIRYPFPEAAILWDSSSSCCIDELPFSAAFDEEHYQQLPRQQRLPLQHSFSAQQPHTQQQQDSHEDQQARLRLQSLQQQRGGRTVSSAAILPSECGSGGARVPSLVKFPSSPAGRGTQIGRNSAESERGAAAVAEAGAAAGGCALYLPCSSRQGTGGPSCQRAAATTPEETSADGAAVAEAAEIHNSVAISDRKTCSSAAVSIHTRGDRVAAAGAAVGGRKVTSSNWSGLVGGAAEKEAAAQEVLVELRRVTKTRAAAAAATGEAEGEGKHLLLQVPTATTSPRKIVPLHRHWVQQLLLQQKKHQQRVQRLQQRQQQRLRQQRQTQERHAHNTQPPEQHTKQQEVQDTKQQQLQHTSEQHPTREQRQHRLWRGDRALQQRNTSKQSEGDDRLHKKKRCCKPGNAAAGVEEAKPSIHEKPFPTQSHTVPSFDAAAASCVDESGLTRNINAIHVSATHSAVPASASPVAGAPGAASAAPVDPAVAPGTVPVDCSGSATAAPRAAIVGTAAPLGAPAVSIHRSCPAVPLVSAAEGISLWPSFDSQSSLHKNCDVPSATAAAADRSLRRAAGAETQCPAAADAVDVSLIRARSLHRRSPRQSSSNVPTTKKNLHVYAGSGNTPAVAAHQQGECWPMPYENLRLTTPGVLPLASTATSASLASDAVGVGVAHLHAASAADVWSAIGPIAAPIHRTAQREQKVRSSEPRMDGPVDAPLSRNILPLKGSRTVLQQPWAVERWSSACATASAPATAQRSGLPEKGTPGATSKTSGATAPAPEIAAAVSNFAVTSVAKAPAPRVVNREKGNTVSTALEGTEERTKNNATTKARNSRRTDPRQRLNSNSSTGERHCSREKAAPLAAAAAEGKGLVKKTGGRIASTPQRLRKLHTNAQQQPERSLQERQQREVVENELVVRGGHVTPGGVPPAEDVQRERHQRQHDAANKRVYTETVTKNSQGRKEEETGRGAIFGEDTANRVRLQQTLQRLRASLLLNTWETGSPDTAQRQKKYAEHSSTSGPHHDSSCSSRGKRQQHSSTSNRRSSHCGAAARPSQTSVAGVNFSHLSRSSNEPPGLAAYLPKGNEAAGKSGGGSKDTRDVRAPWGGRSNGKDMKERQRNPLVDAAATAAVSAALAVAAGAGEPAKGITSTEACGNRLQQLFTSTTGSNTGQEKYGRQQKEQREQLQHQWRPDEGDGRDRKCQTTGDLSYDSSRGSPNCTSTSSSRSTSNRGADASRSRRRNSSITSCTPSTILLRLRRLLQKESSPCSLEWSQKGRAKRHYFSSSCSSRSGSQRCTSTQRRGRSRRNNKNSDRDSRSGNHIASSSGSPTYLRTVSPSSTSSRRSGSTSSISCKEIAEASKRMWWRLLKYGSRRMAHSSRISSPSRHGAGVSSKSSGSGRGVSNSGSFCFTDSSSEESSSEGNSSNSANNSRGARSSSFTNKHSNGDGSDFPESWIKRFRHKRKRNLTAAANCVPAVDGAPAAAGRGAATDGIRGAFPTGNPAAVVGEGRAAAPSGKREDPAPSLISLWLQYSAAALEVSDKQQQQQAAQGKQQLKEKVHADRIQRSLRGSSGYCLPAAHGSKTRTGGKSRGRRNWRYLVNSSNSNQSSSRSGRRGNALQRSNSRSSGRGGSITSTANTPSDENGALSLDPDAFIRRIKRRLRLPLSPRLKNRQQQQRQKRYSSEVSSSSNRCPGRDDPEKQQQRDTSRIHKHRHQHQPQRLGQLHKPQLKKQQASGEEGTGAPESKTDVDREHQQRDEEQHHGKFVHSHKGDEQATGDAIKMQRDREQHIAAIPGGATTGAAAAASTAAVAAGVDDPSGPLRLSALGSPTPSLAALDAEVQFHRQQKDKLPQQERRHAQKEEERPQDEEEQALQQTKQPQSQNQPCQQERGPESTRRLETGLRRNASPCRAAATAADDNAVADQLTAGGACDTVLVMYAPLPTVAAVEGGQTETPAAVQPSEAAVDAVSGAAVGQMIETAYTAVSRESADDVIAQNERTALLRADEETDHRTDYDKRATAADVLSAEKGRIEPQPQLTREQEQQRNVNMQEKETSEWQVEIRSCSRQQEAGQKNAETQQQQQHGEMQQLHQTAQQQEQSACRLGEKQPAPAVAAKDEAHEGERMHIASNGAESLQLQSLLCRAQEEGLPSGRQQAPVTTKEVQSVAEWHAATVLRAPATADLVSNASGSSAAESSPSGAAADVASAANRKADAAVAPETAAVLEDTGAARVRVTADHDDASARTEDTDETCLAAGVTVETEAAGAEVQGDALGDVDVLPASATRVAPCDVVSREQQKGTAAAVESGPPGSPGAATAAGRGFTSVKSTSSVVSFSFSLSSSSGSNRSLDSSTSSSNSTVNSNVANNDGCLHKTSSSSLGSVECRGRRFLPESAATAEYGLSREDFPTTPCGVAKPTAGTAAGGLLYGVPDAEGHFAAAGPATSRMAGAAKTLDLEVSRNNPAASAASCSMYQSSGSRGASGTAAAEDGSTAAVSGERESATVATAELPSAGSEAAGNGFHEWRRGSSAPVQQQPVRSHCSSDRSHYRRRQREMFLKEATHCFLDVKAEGVPSTSTTAHANFDELPAAGGTAPRPHVDARATYPGGRAAEVCAGIGCPLVCATPQDEQHQSQQSKEVLREVLLTKEAPPPEVLALLKQQQRQLKSSRADFGLPAYRCAHGREQWSPLLLPAPAKRATQQEEGQEQKPRDRRRKRSKLQQQAPQRRRACAAAPSPVCVAGATDVSASLREGGQAGDICDEIASFVEIVSRVLGGGKEADGSLASGSGATADAFLADAALCSKSCATIHDGKILVERPPLAADSDPRMWGGDCKLADAVSSVSVCASAAASRAAHYWKGEWFAAALAELQQLLGEREGFPCRAVADPPLQPFISSSSSSHENSQDARRMQEQLYAQGGKGGIKSNKRSTVGAVRCGNATATDAAYLEAGERSSMSKCSSLRVCGGGRTAAAPRKEKKEAAQCVCLEASEEVEAFTANVHTECEPQTTMKDRHFHGARAAWRWCSASQKEGSLPAATVADQCTKKYRRVKGYAEKAPTSSSRGLTNRRCGCSTGLRHFSCSGGHANRLKNIDSKQQNERTKSRSGSGRSSIDSTELSDRSTQDERCAGKLYPCVHMWAAGTGRTNNRGSSSSKCSSRSHDACGCASAYSKGLGNGKLHNSSRSTSAWSSTTSCCFGAYKQQEVEERDTVQQQSPTQGASKPDCRTNRSVRRLHRRRHHWHEPQQQQRQHQKQHRERGDRQGSADGGEHRADRFLEHFQDVPCRYTGQCFTRNSQQQQQQQLQHQQQQMAWSCRRKAGHTSSRRRVLEQSRALSRSSLVCEQERTWSFSCSREQLPKIASFSPQGEGQLLQGLQGLPQQRDEIGGEHDLAWCWREWGGCEIYKEQRSRLQAMLSGALKGPG